MTALELADALSRITLATALIIFILLLLTDRLVTRGRLEEKQTELDRERKAHDEDRAVIRALQHRDDDSVQ